MTLVLRFHSEPLPSHSRQLCLLPFGCHMERSAFCSSVGRMGNHQPRCSVCGPERAELLSYTWLCTGNTWRTETERRMVAAYLRDAESVLFLAAWSGLENILFSLQSQWRQTQKTLTGYENGLFWEGLVQSDSSWKFQNVAEDSRNFH